jgi:hypothetical protein
MGKDTRQEPLVRRKEAEELNPMKAIEMPESRKELKCAQGTTHIGQ